MHTMNTSGGRFLIGCSLAVLLAGCGGATAPVEGEHAEGPTEPVPVEAVAVKRDVLRPVLDLVGTTAAMPERIAVISPQLGGWVEKVHVVDGQKVAAGSVLVTLDARIPTVDLERAKAAVAEKQAVVARLKRGSLPQELEAARQDRDKARATMEGLRGETTALKDLMSRNEVSKVQYEFKVKLLQAAEAALASASAHVQLLEEGTAKELIDEAQAQLDSMKAGLHHAELAVKLCTITSPVDGTVVQLLARQGQFFDRASPLATVIDMRELFVHLRVPSDQFAHVREGTPVEVRPTSLPDQIFSAKVARINGEADPLTGNVDAFAALTNTDNVLRPGMGCRARVSLPEITGSLSVPLSAVADHAGKAIVTVVREGKAHELDVELGVQTSDRVEVRKGLSSADTVITAGGYGLPDGCPVRVVPNLATARTAGL
jgi:HlyD family secretion protein